MASFFLFLNPRNLIISLRVNLKSPVCVFGKALGNGFPISAVIGRSKIMKYAQDTFISSTFWTERVGYVAAIATIEKFVKNKVHNHLIKMGKEVNKIWTKAAIKADINISIDGLEPLTHINISWDDASKIQTIYTQEMLRGFLTGSSVYTSYAYDKVAIKKFNKAINDVFMILKIAKESGRIDNFIILKKSIQVRDSHKKMLNDQFSLKIKLRLLLVVMGS